MSIAEHETLVRLIDDIDAALEKMFSLTRKSPLFDTRVIDLMTDLEGLRYSLEAVATRNYGKSGRTIYDRRDPILISGG